MKQQQIQQMTQIDHVLKRPSMYIGSIVSERHSEFILKDEQFILSERVYTPGLIKIFNEIIDNSIDEYVRTKGKFSTKICIKMDSSTFECSDNGRGIPNTKMKNLNNKTKYQAEIAFTEMLSGANYSDEDSTTIGTNGLGSKASSIFSLKSIIKNDDGKELLTIETSNSLNTVKSKISKSIKSGVYVKIYPDLKYFNKKEISEEEISKVQERLYHLSISYPSIAFKFNGKIIKLKASNYFKMFNVNNCIQINDDVSIGITHSPSDQFEHFSIVNGLVTKDGGAHINFISSEIINPIRDKLIKKFKSIKPGDIKQKLRLVVIFKNFKNTRYSSQTKDSITNSVNEIKEYLDINKTFEKEMKKFLVKVLKDDDIILPISELFLLKEQAKQNVELKKLSKVKKKIRSDKYTPSIGLTKRLFIGEGASAISGILPSVGRKGNSFYELKGKPLNSLTATQSKFTNNKELSELFKIIKNGIDFKEIRDGKWFEIEINDEIIQVNEFDKIIIDGEYISVIDLLKTI